MCYHYTTSQDRICKKAGAAGLFALWGGIWGSNPRHPEPQSGALPTELIPPNRPHKLRIVSLPRMLESSLAALLVLPKTDPLRWALFLFSAEDSCCIPSFPCPEAKPNAVGLIREGRRSLRICSFRGSYANRGNGMELASSDAGTPRGIRTPDLLLRRQLLYPAELLAHKRLTKAQRGACRLERVMGIEPTYPAWKAGVLPLNYTRTGCSASR